MNRALFLDRDGVINEDYGYVHKIEDFHFREGIFDVCRAAQKARMKIIVVTNQAGIGRGKYNLSDYLALNDHMIKQLSNISIEIADTIYCPFHPIEGVGAYKKHSYFRKPNPGMIVHASNRHNINVFQSVMIGDSVTDRIAALSAGIRWFIDASQSCWPSNAINVISALQ